MKLKTLFLAALAVLAIASCDSKKKMILGVQVDPAEIYLTKEDNASSSFEVYASDSWTVKSTADWLNVSQDKGKGDASMSVWATANPGKPRKATVIFRCGYYHYATLTVTQQGEQAAGDGSSPEKAFTPDEARELVLDPMGGLGRPAARSCASPRHTSPKATSSSTPTSSTRTTAGKPTCCLSGTSKGYL